MLRLRITQETVGPDHYRVRVELEGEGLARQTADVGLEFKLSEQDEEGLRWYLEDYLQYPHEPAPTIAARVERRIAEIGTGLFKAIFHANDDARDLWAKLRERLNDTRVEIVTGVREAASVPCEQLRGPQERRPCGGRTRPSGHSMRVTNRSPPSGRRGRSPRGPRSAIRAT